MLDTAEAMVSTGLAELGFEYVNLDAGWLTSSRNPNTSELIPVPEKWPSGISFLSNTIHSKGLKLGVYTDISDHTCGWGPGSYHHYNVDAKTFARWGVDYLKVDYCGAYSGQWQFPSLERSCGAGALGAGGDLYKENTTITKALKKCKDDADCGGFTTADKVCTIDPSNDSTIRQIWFKDQTTRYAHARRARTPCTHARTVVHTFSHMHVQLFTRMHILVRTHAHAHTSNARKEEKKKRKKMI